MRFHAVVKGNESEALQAARERFPKGTDIQVSSQDHELVYHDTRLTIQGEGIGDIFCTWFAETSLDDCEWGKGYPIGSLLLHMNISDRTPKTGSTSNGPS